jgi:outer membrane lipoprotein SlyB
MILNNMIKSLQAHQAGFCFLILFFITGCSKNDSKVGDPYDPTQAKILSNEFYGSFISKSRCLSPPNRNNSTKPWYSFMEGSGSLVIKANWIR